MKKAFILIFVLLLYSCAGMTPEGKPDQADSIGTGTEAFKYPYSEIARIYDETLDAMTDNYYSKYPDLDKEHTQALKRFIQNESPRADFVRRMVQDEYLIAFDRAAEDEVFRETEEFGRVLESAQWLSRSMAPVIISSDRCVYDAMFIEKNPLKAWLFQFATKDHQVFVSWVTEEVSEAEVNKAMGDEWEYKKGDRFFRFDSPPENWRNLAGAAGFLQVRDDQIIQAAVTEMN